MAASSKVGEAYVELQARMAKFEAQLKSAEMLTGKSVGRMQAKFQALAPTFRKVGIGMAVAGGAITAALGLTIKSSISFNKEMANIATLIPGATKRVIELKSAIRTMAVDVGKDTGDLAQGAYQVISAFGDTADTVAILKMSARAATAGVATTTDAINLLSAVTKGYGDTSKEAVQKASDLAFQTVTLGQTTFPELAASIGKAIPLAAELGIAEEELFTVMATGTGVTGKAAEVSTQLRGIFQSFLAPTADMTKLLEDMGYETGKAMLAEEGLHGALQSIIKAAEDSGMPLQKYISSIEGQTIALALTGAQSDTYIEKLAKMRDSVGLTDVAFKEQTEGVNKTGFAFQQAKIRIGVLSQEIGDRLLPMITPLIEKVTEIVKRMSDWSKEHPKLTSALVKFAVVLGPLLIGLGALMMILPGLPALIAAIGVAFHIAMGPIGLIAMAIAGATAAFIYFYKTNEKFRGAIQKMGAYLEYAGRVIMEVFKTVGANIGNFLGWFSIEFPHVFRDVASAAGTILKNLGGNIGKWAIYIGKKLNPKNWLKKIEAPDWTPLLEGFEATVKEIPRLLGINLDEAKGILKTKLILIDAEFMKVIDTIDEMGDAIVDAGKKGGEALENLAESIEKVTEAYERGISTYNQAVEALNKLNIVSAVHWHIMEGIGNAYKRGISIHRGYIPEVEKLRNVTAELWHIMDAIIKVYERGISTYNQTAQATKKVRIVTAELWHVMEGVGNAYERGISIFKGYIDKTERARTVSADFWHITDSLGESVYRYTLTTEEAAEAIRRRMLAEQSFHYEMAKLMGDETALLAIEIERRIEQYRREGWTEVEIQTWVKEFRARKEEEITEKIKEETQKRIAAAGEAAEKTEKAVESTARVIRIHYWTIASSYKYAMDEFDAANRKRFVSWMAFASEIEDLAYTQHAQYEKNLEYLRDKFPAAYRQLVEEIRVYKEEGITTYNIFLKKIISIQDAWQSASASIRDSFTTLVANIIEGTKTMEEIWADFTIAIKKAFIDALAKVLIEKLMLDIHLEANVLEWKGSWEDLAEYIKDKMSVALKDIGEKARSIIPIAQAIASAFSEAWGTAGLAKIPTLPTIPSYQMGTPYVPRTGLYQLERGEKVISAPRARMGLGQAGGGTIIIQSGAFPIQFPNVTSFQDWFNADPGLIKQVTERKILTAMKTLAREGKVSKESVMMG